MSRSNRLYAWFDSDDIDGDGISEGAAETGLSGSEILAWVNKEATAALDASASSGTAPTLVQGALNGHDVAELSGGFARFAIDSNNKFTIFAVIRNDDWDPGTGGAEDYLSGRTGTGDGELVHWGIGDNSGPVLLHERAAYSEALMDSYSTASLSAWHIATFIHRNANPRSLAYRLDGSTVYSFGTGNIGNLDIEMYIGASAAAATDRFWEGRIAELLIFGNDDLTNIAYPQEPDIRQYLRDKWGL
jgi:hypothetical protein